MCLYNHNNWSFSNGFFSIYGAGEAFKYGWAYEPDPGKRKTHHNLAVFNKNFGFVEQNLLQVSLGPVMEYSNNTVYKCHSGFGADPGFFNCEIGYANVVYRNNLVYNSTFGAYWDQIYLSACNGFPPYTVQHHNTWIPKSENPFWSYNDTVKVTDDDFELILDSITAFTQMSAPRKSDGSLPDLLFLKLAGISDLIDMGIDIGFAFNEAVSDLGTYE